MNFVFTTQDNLEMSRAPYFTVLYVINKYKLFNNLVTQKNKNIKTHKRSGETKDNLSYVLYPFKPSQIKTFTQ